MPGPLQDTSVLITGAGRGLGQASALAFAGQGARVVVNDIDPTLGEETVRQIRAVGGEAVFVAGDISQEADVEALVAAAVARHGRLDAAINNAGLMGAAAGVAEVELDGWKRLMDVNVTGTMLCMKYEVRQMVAQGGGAIVNLASIAGLRPTKAGYAAYSTSKAAIIGLTRAAAIQYAADGVRVNAVCPGTIESDTTRTLRGLDADPAALAFAIGQHPLGRLGQPDEVAQAQLFLCSPAAAFITGAVLPIDGGRHI